MGSYTLMQWEGGVPYYINDTERDLQGGFVLEGTVQRIGWNERTILAQRKATVGGDIDGWMVLDVGSGRMEGPLSDAHVAAREDLREIEVVDPATAWERLD